MTYTELKTQVADWLNRTDLTAVIPSFVSLAEKALARRLRVRQMLTATTLDVNAELVALPDDYAEWRALALSTSNGPMPVRYVTPDRANLLMPPETDQPAYFSVEGTSLRFIPAPDQDYTARLLYYATLPVLSADVTTNWLLEEAPDVYLYATLIEAAPYLRDDERVPVWREQLERRVTDFVAASERSQTGGGPLMALPPRGFD